MNIGKQAEALGYAPSFAAIDRVIVTNGESSYRSPNVSDTQWNAMTGYILQVENPYASQSVADRIRNLVKTKVYQPYSASGATLDPAAELGDAVTVDGVTSKLYSINSTLDGRYASDISAPYQKEVDHEYPYVSQKERSVDQKLSQNSAAIKVAEDEINLKVSKDAIISEINQSAEAVTISASKINLDGITKVNHSLTIGTTANQGSTIVLNSSQGGGQIATTYGNGDMYISGNKRVIIDSNRSGGSGTYAGSLDLGASAATLSFDYNNGGVIRSVAELELSSSGIKAGGPSDLHSVMTQKVVKTTIDDSLSNFETTHGVLEPVGGTRTFKMGRLLEAHFEVRVAAKNSSGRVFEGNFVSDEYNPIDDADVTTITNYGDHFYCCRLRVRNNQASVIVLPIGNFTVGENITFSFVYLLHKED